MLDQLIKLVEQNAGDAIVNNPAIPNQFNNDAIQEVAQQIFTGLQGQVQQGNLQQVVGMFKGSSGSSLTSNPMVAQIISSVAGNFAAKFGVSPQLAQQVVSGLVPQVMNQFVNKTNDPNDGDFDLQDMMRNFSGNSGLDIGDLLGQFSGGKTGGLGNVLGKLFR